MNQPIQAYDIYNNAAYSEIGSVEGAENLSAESMAKIANLLVKYGFVSPPVWVLRNKDNGKLLEEIVVGEVFMTGNPDKAEIQGAVYEHWKGQME